MRIAVNAQTLVKDKLEGLGWFSYENLKRIVKSHPEHEFVFIFNKGIDESFLFAPNVKGINIGPPFNRPLAWLLKFEFLLPWYINRNKFDLYLSTDGWSSTRIKIPTFLVVHDLNFEHFPQWLPFSFRTYYRFFFKKWVREAAGLATVSEYSKNDMADTYGIDKKIISVVYNGIGDAYSPLSTEEKEQLRINYTQSRPYFVFVGALHPRKNLANILLAFEKFKLESNNKVCFVVVGERFYWDKNTAKVYEKMSHKADVIFTGRLTQDKLAKVLGAALGLTYVSLFEGFGIPLIEAMQCEVPIITSNCSSMPEIAGDAALVVDPNNVDEIAEAMMELNNNENTRDQLVESGKKQVKKFNWESSAKALWQAIEKVLK